jgi:hypothetical protein
LICALRDLQQLLHPEGYFLKQNCHMNVHDLDTMIATAAATYKALNITSADLQTNIRQGCDKSAMNERS